MGVEPYRLVQVSRIALMGNGVVEGLVVIDRIPVDVDDVLGTVINWRSQIKGRT